MPRSCETEIQKAHSLFNDAIEPFFSQNSEDFLTTEGLLRLSARKEAIDSAIERGKIPAESDYHTRIGILKDRVKYVTEDFLSSIAAKEIENFKENYENKDKEIKKTALEDFISALANSNDIEKIRIAEMLHNLIYLGKIISDRAKKNKMTVENVSTIIGPYFFAILYPNVSNPADYVTYTSQTNNFLAEKLNDFNEPFSVAYNESQKILDSAAKKERTSENFNFTNGVEEEGELTEKQLLRQADRVVWSHPTSQMAKDIRNELLRLKAVGNSVNLIHAACNLYYALI